MIRSIALSALLLLLVESAAGQVGFVIDSTRSDLSIGVTLTIGISPSDTEETAITGFFEADITDSDLHLTAGRIVLSDSLHFRFRYGSGIFSLGTITAAASPSALSLEIVTPGPQAAYEGGVFSQSNNGVMLKGELNLKGDGAFTSMIPTDPQNIEIPGIMTLAGTVQFEEGFYRLDLPLEFEGTFDLGDAVVDVRLRGNIIAESPSTVASEERPSTYEIETSVYPNPVHGPARLTFALQKAQHVRISLYDLQGRRIATVAERLFSSGRQEFAFDASHLNTGVYFVELIGEGIRDAVPMVVME